ncbi:carbamate kinase [Staphylothermus hellenicus]|uniref:Carbamate kinase n=1 Tax=Staphylothermus hellenicus (strain DSM 12710 / JCM 10830 / BK20S6-10-b1 / P8) TaxID=591019 RepID=D7DC12_STAHD|nr:carbamate kinase [Staphylothermus hellenicus]ADI31709.1 carbamate kinase [Staphylothermus hellenicus DSM 12710]
MDRHEKYIVVAFGGNAFQTKGEKGTPENYWKNAYRSAEFLVKIISEGYKVAITHGNGPQVGIIAEWMLAGKKLKGLDVMTLDIAGAMSQGWLGYLIQQSLYNKLQEQGLLGKIVKGIVTIVTQTIVDKNDPAFQNPTKYIGPWYNEEEAKQLAKEFDWTVKPDPRGGWRRVVPSPDPKGHVEIEAVKKLLNEGFIVIASGGGGIPVYKNDKGLIHGVEAVIDKDLAGERLATAIGAGTFMILTDVDKVYLNYGKPDQKPVDVLTVSEAKKYYEEGHFKPGSMGPKVLAAIRFIENGGKQAIIGHLTQAYEALKGKAGTRIVPD